MPCTFGAPGRVWAWKCPGFGWCTDGALHPPPPRRSLVCWFSAIHLSCGASEASCLSELTRVPRVIPIAQTWRTGPLSHELVRSLSAGSLSWPPFLLLACQVLFSGHLESVHHISQPCMLPIRIRLDSHVSVCLGGLPPWYLGYPLRQSTTHTLGRPMGSHQPIVPGLIHADPHSGNICLSTVANSGGNLAVTGVPLSWG